jgi:GNAT superfamily N-acetyltransferase
MERSLQIRQATPEDAAAVADVLHLSFIEFRPLYTPEGFAATTPNAEQILTRLQEGPCWVALQGNYVLGTVAAIMKGESLYIRGMAVVPVARGLGAGKRLLETVERYASVAACNRMFLSTTPFLSAAIHLYERFGFQRTSEGPCDLFGTPLFTMEKIATLTK